MRSRAALVLVPVIMLLSPGSAAGRVVRLRLGSVTAARSPVVTDDHRWGAWRRTDGRLGVVDTATGARQAAALPASCPNGSPTAVGGGQVLIDCYPDPPLLYDLRQKAVHAPAGVDGLRATGGDASASAGDVGSVWLSVLGSGYHSSTTSYVDWHTGAQRGEVDGAAVVPDLDREDLARPLCPPLRRTRTRGVGEDVTNSWDLSFQFDGTAAVHPFASTPEETGFTLQRCGSAHPLRYPLWQRLQLGGGWVSGVGARLELLSVGTGRRYDAATRAVFASHTATRAFVARTTGSPPDGRWLIRSLRLPGASHR